MDPISATGIIISLAIAYWQYRKAHRAELQLQSALKRIPKDTLSELGAVVTVSSNAAATLKQPAEQPIERAFITYADVNGDSKDEMLVQYPTGPHGIVLKVLGFREHEFGILAELGCGTPEGFSFGDFDGDGKIEISARETDWTAHLPYASAPRITVIYKWDGQAFTEIAESKDRLNVSLASAPTETAARRSHPGKAKKKRRSARR